MTPEELAKRLNGVEAGGILLKRSICDSESICLYGWGKHLHMDIRSTLLINLCRAVCRAAGDRVVEHKELGPYGCLCKSMHHHVTGDGCELCNPKMAEEITQGATNE